MGNKSIELIDQLLKTRDFNELNEFEKLLVEEHLGGERIYQKYRSLVLASSTEYEMPVSSSVKQSLMAKMTKQHQPVWVKAFNYRLPAYASAAIAVLLMTVIYLMLPTKEIVVEKTVEIPATPITDTVFVQGKTDTIFVERKVEVPVYITVNEPKSEQEEVNSSFTGKTLADQQDIRSLLVGSE
ncbi:MAG: hypothetical protein CMO01_19030 [Thalassobius sp.]|nr:hypothetical protein [Thalassovita sp.]